MFWARKLKQADETESSWMLSYGDMVTLLLAVFIMIAAMGDLKSGGERFKQVTGGMRRAFGFAAAKTVAAGPQLRRPPTLLERFEQAGFVRRSQVSLVGPDDEVLAPCDLVLDGDLMIVRIAGHASFARGSAVLQPSAVKAVGRVAEFLAGGHNRIEVRGHADEGPTSAVGSVFRDGMDLSYGRARAVAAGLVEHGVDRQRLFVTAWGDSSPLSSLSAAAPKRTELSTRPRPDRRVTCRTGRIVELKLSCTPFPRRGTSRLSPGRTDD